MLVKNRTRHWTIRLLVEDSVMCCNRHPKCTCKSYHRCMKNAAPGISSVLFLLFITSGIAGCASKPTLETFRTDDAPCYDRSVQPQTPVVDSHLHFRPFGGPAIPFSEVVSYLEKTGVLFVNIYGIGQMLPGGVILYLLSGLSGHAGESLCEERFRQCRQLCDEGSARYPHDALDDLPGFVETANRLFPACDSWRKNTPIRLHGWAKSTW